MADETYVTQAICPSCGDALEMTEQGGPFSSDIYTCYSCNTRYKYQTPPDADWTPPKTK